MRGYEEADKIDSKVNSLLQKFPIEDNPMEWLKFSRTIETTMTIIKELAKEEITK